MTIERSRHQRRRLTFARTLRFAHRKGQQGIQRGTQKMPHQGQYVLFMEGGILMGLLRSKGVIPEDPGKGHPVW
jgi:hypothetical protein